MIDDKELIRRALLGDNRAQQECTKREIVLPCPKCGKGKIIFWDKKMKWYSCWDCGMKSGPKKSFGEALRDWNTRPVPPIGRCKDCINATNPGNNIVFCDYFERDVMPDDFCSCFEPREE